MLTLELQTSAVAAYGLLLITPSMPSLARVAETLSVQGKRNAYKRQYIPSLHNQHMKRTTRSQNIPVLLLGPPLRLFFAGGSSMCDSRRLCDRLRWSWNVCSEMTHSPAFENQRFSSPFHIGFPVQKIYRLADVTNPKNREASRGNQRRYLPTPQPLRYRYPAKHRTALHRTMHPHLTTPTRGVPLAYKLPRHPHIHRQSWSH